MSSNFRPALVCLSFSLNNQYSFHNLEEADEHELKDEKQKNIPPKIVINWLHIVATIHRKIIMDFFVDINRKNKNSNQLVKFQFGPFCDTFLSSLILGILCRVGKQLLPIYRVLFQPVKKSLGSHCCPGDAMDPWLLTAVRWQLAWDPLHQRNWQWDQTRWLLMMVFRLI